MLRPHLLRRNHARSLLQLHANLLRSARCYCNDRRSQDPLNILFCGADEFSIHSLRAVHELRRRRPESIASVEVVCRPDKRVGRGLKRIQEVPIRSVAEALDIPVHQIDTFTGWSPPSPADLVIAVSFGLLVPSRILKAAQHGGLNIHPSLLPEFRGPAPIQHALLQARTFTGVTLQTMHPTRFDHGRILDQTPAPGIPIPAGATVADLVEILGASGADMLSRGIENKLWLDPEIPARSDALAGSKEASHAPKIMPGDRQIDWHTWTAERIIRYDRVIGRLWDTVSYQRCLAPIAVMAKRITFHGPWRKVTPEYASDYRSSDIQPGDVVHIKLPDSPSSSLAFMTCDGSLLKPSAATIEGDKRHRGIETLSRALQFKQGP